MRVQGNRSVPQEEISHTIWNPNRQYWGFKNGELVKKTVEKGKGQERDNNQKNEKNVTDTEVEKDLQHTTARYQDKGLRGGMDKQQRTIKDKVAFERLPILEKGENTAEMSKGQEWKIQNESSVRKEKNKELQ